MRGQDIRAWGAVLALVVTAACAGESTTSPSPAKSAEPPSSLVQARVNQVLSNFVSTFNAHKSSGPPRSMAVAPRLDPLSGFKPEGTTCNANGSQCQIFEQWDTRDACPSGGYLGNSGTMSGAINASTTSASGTLNWTSYQVYANCSDNGWLTNSDPYFQMGGTVRISTSAQTSRTTMNITVGGGFVISNAPGTPNGKVSCYNSGVLLQWDNLTGWSNSGSLSCSNGVTVKY